MSSYIKVKFIDYPTAPSYVYSATLIQERYKHDFLEILFRDWDVQYEAVAPGSPVEVTIKSVTDKKKFFGYVHHIEPKKTPGTNFTKVSIIGASFLFKSPSQTTYLNTTADTVIKKIAKAHGFVCYADPHPRVYKQISQAGQSDWELITKLAKQCGYALRAENTELYFHPMLKNYTLFRKEAPVFTMRSAQSIYGTSIYSFEPLIGDTIEYADAKKSAVAVSGVDLETASPIKHTQTKANKKTRSKSKQDFFDDFNSSAVALTLDVARHEATAAEARNSFPYRGRAEVIGNVSLKPNFPVYLKGLGKVYSGYWMVLKATHKIVEEKRNVYKYTTEIELGVDSLGEAERWIDNQEVVEPNSVSKRTIVPGVKHTTTKPTTSIKKVSNIISPQLTAPFGSTSNRATTTTSGQALQPNIWRSDNTSATNAKEEPVKSAAVTARIARGFAL